MSTSTPVITLYWVNATSTEIFYDVTGSPQPLTMQPSEESQAVSQILPESGYQNLPMVQLQGANETVFQILLTEKGGVYSVTVQGENGVNPISKSGHSSKYEVKLHLEIGTGGGLIVGVIDILGEGDLIA